MEVLSSFYILNGETESQLSLVRHAMNHLSDKTKFVWVSPKIIGGVFLYSLLFFAMQIKSITAVCVFLIFPFLPVAYLGGGLMSAVLNNATVGYAIGAWLTVFLQAYLLVALVRLAYKKRVLFHVWFILVTLTSFVNLAKADTLPALPKPLIMEWDISKADSELTQDFSVTDYYAYNMYLGFLVFERTKEGENELTKFTGDGAYCAFDKMHYKCVDWDTYKKLPPSVQQGSYEIRNVHPGVMIPVHIKIEKIDDPQNVKVVLDKTYNTTGIAAGRPTGGLQRDIGFVKLKRGKYRLTANTLQNTNLPRNITKTFLDIYAPPKVLPLNDDQ